MGFKLNTQGGPIKWEKTANYYSTERPDTAEGDDSINENAEDFTDVEDNIDRPKDNDMKENLLGDKYDSIKDDYDDFDDKNYDNEIEQPGSSLVTFVSNNHDE